MNIIKLKQNDIVILDIIDYGMNGEGIAKKDGIVIFVPFAMKGERIKAKITYVKKSFATAKLVDLIIQSKDRIESPCNRFGRCGGCNLLHIRYEEQLNLKKNQLKTTLRKNMGKDIEVGECVRSDKEYGYRNKVQLPFGKVNNKVAVGFYGESTHKIASITKCFLHDVWLEKLIEIVLQFCNSNYFPVYDEITHKGLLRHLVARFIDDQLSVVIVINGKTLPKSEELEKMLSEQFPSFSLHLSINEEKTNVIMGKTLVPLKENDFTIDILGIKINLNPLSFLQINDFIRDEIYKQVIDFVKESDIVIDVYSGLGIIGAVLAKNGVKKIYNIEIVPEAINDANILAQANGITEQVQNICGDSTTVLPELINNIMGNQIDNDANISAPTNGITEQVQNLCGDTAVMSTKSINNTMGNQANNNEHPKESISIILDPPRKGVSQALVETLNAITVPIKLVYISCNPATLSRDLAILTKNDIYVINSVSPYDMFPQTKHLETLVLLCRK